MIPEFLLGFGLSQFVCFLLGIAAANVWWVLKAKYLNWRHGGDRKPPKWGPRGTVFLAVGIVLVGSLFVGVQQERTARAVRAISAETQQCQHELLVALEARSAASIANDTESRIQRDEVAAWIGKLLNPPPEIAALPPDSPQRREYGIRVTEDYVAVVHASQAREAENDRQRVAHPFPEPSCGQ